jgi:hypothetical protein
VPAVALPTTPGREVRAPARDLHKFRRAFFERVPARMQALCCRPTVHVTHNSTGAPRIRQPPLQAGEVGGVLPRREGCADPRRRIDGKDQPRGLAVHNGLYWKVYSEGRGKHRFVSGDKNDELFGHDGNDTVSGGGGKT